MEQLDKREIDKRVDYKLFEAFRLLESTNLLYFRFLSKLNFIIDDKIQHIGAVGYNPVKNKIYMILQQKALLMQSDKSAKSKEYIETVKDLAGLLEHECGHILYEHIFNRDVKIKHHLKNIAEDCIINDSCNFIVNRMAEIEAKDSTSMLKGGCFYKNFQKKITKLQGINSEDLTSLELYYIMLDDQKENPQNYPPPPQKGQGQQQQGQGQPNQKGQGGNSSGQGNGQPDPNGQQSNGGSGGDQDGPLGDSFDSHDPFSITEDKDGNEQIEAGGQGGPDSENVESQIQAAAQNALNEAIQELKNKNELNKAIGQLSGNMKRSIMGMLKSKTDRSTVLNFLNRVVIGNKYRWTKLHRRYPMLAKGRLKNKKPKMGVVIDTSGSMGSGELFEMINYQVEQLVNKCEQLYIFVGDTQLEYEVFVKNKRQFNPETISFDGGGGTCMRFGFERANELKLDGLVVHTDGHIGDFDDFGIKTMFYLYGEGCAEIDGYKNVYVHPL